MRKRIDKNFVDALKRAIEAVGGQSELARQSGVGQSTINSIVNPKKGRLFATDAVFDKLFVVIKNYMTDESIKNYGNIVHNSGTSVAVCGSHNNFFTPPASGGINPELIKAAMQGMSPEEKARFLKELHK